MDVFIFDAEMYCEDCGESIRADLDLRGETPFDPDDETTYNSDEYPKGPYSDGGGESDTPGHCGACRTYLGNPLTSVGVEYTLEYLDEAVKRGFRTEVLDVWAADLRDYFLSEGDESRLEQYEGCPSL